MLEQKDRNPMGEREPRRKRFILEFLGWATAIFATVFFAPLLIEEWQPLIGSREEPGVFGDQFGAVNALFSGLAFAGVIVAMRMQSKELQLQQRELVETREVMTDQKKQLELQAAAMQQQTFENTFFQMISLYNQIVAEISYFSDAHHQTIRGKFALDSGFSTYSKQFAAFKKSYPAPTDSSADSDSSRRLRMCRKFHHSTWGSLYGSAFSQYFRHVHRTLRFIDQKGPPEQGGFYSDILRGQMSDQALKLLYYEVLASRDAQHLQRMYIGHGFFNDLEPDDLIHADDWQFCEKTE